MYDTAYQMRIQFDRRHAFYLDAQDDIHPICAYRLDALHRGAPGAALPEMAGKRVRFAIFHVERFTEPPRIVVDFYPVLTLDAEGHVDQQRDYDELQADVDRLEANDYAPPEPLPIEPLPTEPTESSTSWTPDPITHRRLLTALHDLRRALWLPQRPPGPSHRPSDRWPSAA